MKKYISPEMSAIEIEDVISTSNLENKFVEDGGTGDVADVSLFLR